jgi:hypothetical protein
MDAMVISSHKLCRHDVKNILHRQLAWSYLFIEALRGAGENPEAHNEQARMIKLLLRRHTARYGKKVAFFLGILGRD